MAQPMLQFDFHDPQTPQDAQDLADFLRQELPAWSSRVVTDRVPKAKEEHTRSFGDVIAVLSLIVAIPEAVNETWDLAIRMKLKEKFERLLAWAKARKAAGKPTAVVTLLPNRRSVPLEEARLDEILDTIAEQVAAQRPPLP